MDTLERMLALRNDGVAFAVATVVARRAPVSSRIGDRAIVLADGALEGFVGGACAREIVRRQALEALRFERPRLVRITPEPVAPAPPPGPRDEVIVSMTCASEGAVDIYVEPHLERPRLVVVGGSPVAVALARQGEVAGRRVTLVVEADERSAVDVQLEGSRVGVLELSGFGPWLAELPAAQRTAMVAVVASMGHYDEEALAALLGAEPAYLGLVASRKRGGTVLELLGAMGASDEELARVRTPAGLDIGAVTPHEVALSVLAEAVQLRRAAERIAAADAADAAAAAAAGDDEAIDPVCGMTVYVSTARHTAEFGGRSYVFCCPNCQRRFEADPERWLPAGGDAVAGSPA